MTNGSVPFAVQLKVSLKQSPKDGLNKFRLVSDDSYLPNQPVETYPRPVPQAVISSYFHQPAKNSTPNDTRFTPNSKEINQIPENSNQEMLTRDFI